MSYCRAIYNESDVYVYHDVSGGFTCCGCTLETERRPYFNVPTRTDMIRHLGEHKEKGDIVPDYALESLKLDLRLFGETGNGLH